MFIVLSLFYLFRISSVVVLSLTVADNDDLGSTVPTSDAAAITETYATGIADDQTEPTTTIFSIITEASTGAENNGSASVTTTLDDLVLIEETTLAQQTSRSTTEKFKVRYDGYKVLNVVTVNSKERRKVQELEKRNVAERLGAYVTGVHLLVKNENLEDVGRTLLDNSMSYEILIDDLQEQIDKENPPEKEVSFENRKGHRFSFERFHRMSDVHSYLDFLASTRSDFVNTEIIGSSVEGRPLKVIKILSGNPNASAMWIDGGIHAREWISVSTVMYIVNELTENRDKLEKEIQDTDFYLLPIVNPDGYEYTHERERLWRKNRHRHFTSFCAGVDLNRNYPFEWGGKGSGKIPCEETYGGSGALSEPETKAVTKYIMQNRSQYKGFVTFHSYGQYILYPWGYNKKYTPDHDALDRVGRVAAAAIKQATGSSYTVGNSAALLYPASGASDDWAKGTAKIKYTYTIELRDTGRYGFVLPSSEIIPAGKEGLAAVKAIAKEFYV